MNSWGKIGLDRKLMGGLTAAPRPWHSLFFLQKVCSPEISIFYFHMLEHFWVLLSMPIENAGYMDYLDYTGKAIFLKPLFDFFFLQAKILQVVEWWMQTSQCEYEPINQQPHFMRLRPPNCFVSAANYFGEIFLHMEKESVIIIERIQNRNSAVSTSRAQITSSLCFINFLNHSGPMDSKWIGTTNGDAILKFGKKVKRLNSE